MALQSIGNGESWLSIRGKLNSMFTELYAAITGTAWGDITGTLSDQTDLQTALNGKQATIGYTPENVDNKSTSTSLGTSNTSYPSQNAVKSYVDTGLGTKLPSTNSKSQFDTACTDGDFTFDGDSVTNLTMSTAKILGRSTASAGAVEEITVGSGLTLSGGTLSASGSSTKQHRITIPGEQVQDTSNYQGLYFYNDTGATITISNVAVAVGKAAAGSGAAYSVNVYKSSGTAADGLNTNAVALFSSAIALTTSYTSLTNVPDTTTVESGRWVTMRITSSAGATNKASDAQIIITYS